MKDPKLRELAPDAVNLGALKAEPLRDGDVSHVPGGAFVTVSVFVPDGLTRQSLPPSSARDLLQRAQWHGNANATECPWCEASDDRSDRKDQAAGEHKAGCHAAWLMGWPVEKAEVTA